MTIKEKLEGLFDDNENYIHSYTGTPMIDTEKIVPKILTLMQSNSDSQPNGRKPIVSGALPPMAESEKAMLRGKSKYITECPPFSTRKAAYKTGWKDCYLWLLRRQ